MNLKYKAQKEQRKKNNQNKKVTWFKPPHSKQVSTNIAKYFLNLLDQHFPKQHRLYKIFNRNNGKVHAQKICPVLFHLPIKKYNSCTGNIKPCDCRKTDECPLNGQCLAQDIV